MEPTDKKTKVVSTRDKTLSGADAVIKEAQSRFEQVVSFEETNRSEAIDDLNMLAGRGHWPKKIVDERKADRRPVLTVNKLPSFTDQVKNDSRLNKVSIKIKPYSGGATQQLAENLNSIIRNIENVSDADIAYQTAFDSAVDNGFGYFRIVTAFVDDASFDQEIRFKRISNPLSVYLDNKHIEYDGRDIRFGFITEKISRDEYEIRYPGVEITPFNSSMEHSKTAWVGENEIRIAEYWVKEPTVKRLYLLSDERTVDGDKWDSIVDDLKANEQVVHFPTDAGAGQAQGAGMGMGAGMAQGPGPSAPPVAPQGLPAPPAPPAPVEGPAPEGSGFREEVLNPTPKIIKERVINSHKVVHYLIGGDSIIEGPTEWPGKYIPIVPVWGKEIVIDDERFLRGLIRFAKDSQRMYNYFRTAATETVALTPKAPHIVEERQIEGHEDEWNSANTKNLPYLAYKHIRGVPAPKREIVSQTALGEITEANISSDEMKSTTSLHDPSLGAQGNEVSGRAILARQRKGDIANFIFHDNLKRAIKYGGDILIDLIPKIYDTMRQLAVIKEDGSEEMMAVNQPVFDAATGEFVMVNDLTLGRYKVVATSGPSISTQREESVASMLDFMRTAPEAAALMIDVVAENMDWPGAVKIANRFKKLLPPGIDEEGPAPEQGPDTDEIFKQQKIEGTMLGNMLKKLNVVKQKRELSGEGNSVETQGG